MRRPTGPFLPVLAIVLAVSVLGACSDDGDGGDDQGAAPSDESTTSTTSAPTGEAEDRCTTEESGPLEIVLINDDGVINPAIDVLIDRLSQDDALDVDITVVAPADERSGTADATTPGGASYELTTTPGGNEAYAVDGYPADAVLVALGELDLSPDLVLSGINPGLNFGPIAAISGTVGAARTAIRQAVPALAVSASMEFDQAQFDHGADLAAEWIEENCEELLAGEFQTDTIASINLPNCPPEQMGPIQEVALASEMPELPEGESLLDSTCDQSDPDPANDVAAVRAGYPSLTQIGPDL